VTSTTLRIGTRGSLLARTQSATVAQQLADRGFQCELIEISTHADRTAGPIAALGTQGVFTKELQQALLLGDIDLAVHSLKDLPTLVPAGLRLVCTPPRVNPFDALISRSGHQLLDLPSRAIVGTGSPRRAAQLRVVRPDLDIRDLRGNVDTRLRKLHEGQYDAIVLAVAGLERVGMDQVITEVLPPDVMLPAVGQGILGLEARSDDQTTERAVVHLLHRPTMACALAERSYLAALQGGCLAPVAAWARPNESETTIRLTGIVLHPSGSPRLRAESEAPLDAAASLGLEVAEQLLEQGAAELVQVSRVPK